MGVGVDVGVDAGVGGWRFRRKSAGAGTGADLCVGVGIFINVHVSLYAWYLPPIARKARTVPVHYSALNRRAILDLLAETVSASAKTEEGKRLKY